MKRVINIQAAFTLPLQHNDPIPMDLDLINLRDTSIEERCAPPDSAAHVNPYLQDLRSLSEDTFMTNFSSNGINDQLTDSYRKDAPADHTNEVSAALDNLMIISDETPSLHINTYKESDLLFTPKHSFLPNYQKVSEESQDNQYDSTILPNRN
ncbi:hypothetical protein RclHR1_04160002 [Rhizophagus clarus]|uniref:Uncharacterized protein n=1 Tax=Rhizophagus clarus TaxID=94130 RepID=A0A2Z6RSX5_9GLOM|nr:hypothetical protein RclHR1_04160002 [Rhizophagus clarus]